MPTLAERLEKKLGYSPLLESALLQFDKHILLATPHVFALPLSDVFFTCYYIHSVRHPSNYQYEENKHNDSVEIHHCIDGKYEIETNDQPPITLLPGDCAIIAPGVVHRSHCIERGVRLTARAAVNGPNSDSFARQLRKQTKGKILKFDGRSQESTLAEIFYTLLSETLNPWRYEIAGSLIRVWLGTTLSTHLDLSPYALAASSNGFEFSKRGNALCERASAFIYANFQRTLSIEEIAEHTGITPRHLNRLFKKYMGITAGHMLRDVRLTDAMRILGENPKARVKEVAYRTGFSSPSYFTLCFKQQYGILPTEVHLRMAQPLDDAQKLIAASPTERNAI